MTQSNFIIVFTEIISKWKQELAGTVIFAQGNTDISKTKLQTKASERKKIDIYNGWKRQELP